MAPKKITKREALKKLREQNNRVKKALKPVKVSKETAAKRRESVKGKSIAEQKNAPGRPDWKKRREERKLASFLFLNVLDTRTRAHQVCK